MASAICSCRTSALRTFVRSVTQVHLPHENLAKAAPWHETRRQLHQKRTTRWPAVTSLPHRSVRTAATDSASTAGGVEDGQTALEGEEQDLAQERESLNAAAESQPDATQGVSSASDDLIAEEEKLFADTRLSNVANDRKSETRPAFATEPQEQEDAHLYVEDLDMETITVEEIEAAQRERELNRLRMRAERARAKEQARKEQEREKDNKKKEHKKERLKARPEWATQKTALKEKFPEGWRPRKKLSPDALNGIRALNRQFPDTYTTPVLANKFEVSPEAIRRILRSKWEATPEEEEERERRWHNRGVNIWQHYAAIGKKPPVKWREAGVAVKPRGARDRAEPDLFDRYDEPVKDDGVVDYEQRKRFKRQQKLAKHLV